LVILIEPGNYVLWFITGIQAFAIALRAYELLNEWFLSEMKSKYYVIANICGQTVVGIWKIVLLILQASVVWFAASTTVQALVCGSIVITVFLITRDFKLAFCLQYARDIFRQSKHYVLAGLAIALYTQMDKVMLGRMMGEREVGFYTAAMTIAMLWEFIPQAIINSSRVVILEKKKMDEAEYSEKLQLLLFAVSVLGILVGVAVQIFGKLAVRILYGKEYMPAVPVLKLLIWSTTFAMIGVARNIWSVAEEKNQYSKNYTICGGIFNLVFNAVTIPVWGIFGAAVSTLGAQIVVAVLSPMLWKDTRPFVTLYMTSWKKGLDYLYAWSRKVTGKSGS
ncbi:MAG: oligosaccharide flippase family protein, partial [Lachnospiraceae bacterium]|nr:oligosaccharide flippase family protein [Lachnospiraceae bacterium]